MTVRLNYLVTYPPFTPRLKSEKDTELNNHCIHEAVDPANNRVRMGRGGDVARKPNKHGLKQRCGHHWRGIEKYMTYRRIDRKVAHTNLTARSRFRAQRKKRDMRDLGEREISSMNETKGKENKRYTQRKEERMAFNGAKGKSWPILSSRRKGKREKR